MVTNETYPLSDSLGTATGAGALSVNPNSFTNREYIGSPYLDPQLILKSRGFPRLLDRLVGVELTKRRALAARDILEYASLRGTQKQMQIAVDSFVPTISDFYEAAQNVA